MKRFVAAIFVSALVISSVPVLANPSIADPTNIQGSVKTESGETVTINSINTDTVVNDYGEANGTVIAQVNCTNEAITPSDAANADANNNVEVVEAGGDDDISQDELKDYSYISKFGEAGAENISGSTLMMSATDALGINDINDVKDDIEAGNYGAELRDQQGHKADVKVGLDDEGNLIIPIPEEIASPFAYAFIQKTGASE